MTLRTSAVGLALAALVLFPARTASAEDDRGGEDESKPVLALAAGGAITMLSLGVGATIIARSDNRIVRDGGLLGAQSGMVLAPLAAHAIVGEAKRGVWFSLPLLVPLAVNSVVVGFFPGVIRRAPAGVQYTTFISVSVSAFGSLLGVLDAVRAGERKPKKPPPTSTSPSLAIVPMFGDGTAGALIEGSL